MSDYVDDLLLDRYIAGECSPPERSSVDRRLATNLVWARRAEQIRTLQNAARRLPQPWSEDALWRQMRTLLAAPKHGAAPKHLDVEGQERPVQGHADSRRPPRRVTAALPGNRSTRFVGVIAAAAVITMAAGLAALWYTGTAPWAEVVTRYRIEADHGQLTTMRLSDGSRVTLAAGSVLEVPEAFDDQSRDVSLTGQAYFEIARDSTRPFEVHARHTITHVLGTKFQVRAYPEDTEVTVVVAEGRVAFGASDAPGRAQAGDTGKANGPTMDSSIVLMRGDRARLDAQGRMHIEHGVAVGRELTWLEGRLTFMDAPLAEVAREIERWYDVRIVVDDSSLGAVPVTASFGNEPVGRILRSLAISLDVHLERLGDTAWLEVRR